MEHTSWIRWIDSGSMEHTSTIRVFSPHGGLIEWENDASSFSRIDDDTQAFLGFVGPCTLWIEGPVDFVVDGSNGGTLRRISTDEPEYTIRLIRPVRLFGSVRSKSRTEPVA